MEEDGESRSDVSQQKLENVLQQLLELRREVERLQERQDLVTNAIIAIGPKGIIGLRWLALSFYLLLFPLSITVRIVRSSVNFIHEIPQVIHGLKAKFWFLLYRGAFTWVLLRDHPGFIRRIQEFPGKYRDIRLFLKR